MSAAPSQNALTRALNSALATALTRVVVLSLPLLTGAGLWAGHRYLAEQVEQAPAFVALRASHTETLAAVAAQAERIRELEEARRQTALAMGDMVERLKRLDAKADTSSQQLNRLLGAFEARGLLPHQPGLAANELP